MKGRSNEQIGWRKLQRIQQMFGINRVVLCIIRMVFHKYDGIRHAKLNELRFYPGGFAKIIITLLQRVG